MKKFTSMLAAALLVFSVAGTNLADAAEPNTIAVGGMAEQEVAPDMAYVVWALPCAQTMRKLRAPKKQKLHSKYAGRCWGLPLPTTICRIPVTTCIRNIRLTATANALPVSTCLILR